MRFVVWAFECVSGKILCFFFGVSQLRKVCSVRYRYSRYRYGCSTEVTEESGTGIDIVPTLPKCPVPVLMYQNYRSVRYRYESMYRYRRYRYPCRTELTEVSGTGIDVVPNLPNFPVPVLMSCRTYRSVLYRYGCRAELTKCPVPVTPAVYTSCMTWYVPYRTHPSLLATLSIIN